MATKPVLKLQEAQRRERSERFDRRIGTRNRGAGRSNESIEPFGSRGAGRSNESIEPFEQLRPVKRERTHPWYSTYRRSYRTIDAGSERAIQQVPADRSHKLESMRGYAKYEEDDDVPGLLKMIKDLRLLCQRFCLEGVGNCGAIALVHHRKQ